MYSIYAYLQLGALDSDNAELQQMFTDCPWWKKPIVHEGANNQALFVWIKPRIEEHRYDRLQPFLEMLRQIQPYIIELAHNDDMPKPAEMFRQAVDDLGYQDLIQYFVQY
jgi:hypothetical protein